MSGMEHPTKPAADFSEADGSRYAKIRTPRGAEISCKGWHQEAALRMLTNSVDRDVAEAPDSLIPCAALGKVAADWDAFRDIVDTLQDLASDATLLVQRGRSAGVFSTSADSARALIVDSDPAASWLNIGPQLFLPESYDVLHLVKQRYFDDDLRGKLIVAEDVSFVGAALSLATMMQGGAFLGIDEDADRIKRYVKAGYCDVMVNNLDEALRILKNAVRKREPASVGLSGNPIEMTQEMASRGIVPDLLADIENALDESSRALRDGRRELQEWGSVLLGEVDQSPATDNGATVCFVALSGEMADIHRIDRLLLEIVAEDETLARQLRTLQRRGRYQGLPARAFWLNREQRSRLGVAVNRIAQNGLKAPIVIGRLARSLNTIRKREGMNAQTPTGSEFDALLRLITGATWASITHDADGHACIVAAAVLADGTTEASERIERVLTQNFPR